MLTQESLVYPLVLISPSLIFEWNKLGRLTAKTKKKHFQNETDEENCLDEISNRSIRSCSSRRSLLTTSASSSSDTEGEDFLDVTSMSEDGLQVRALVVREQRS